MLILKFYNTCFILINGILAFAIVNYCKLLNFTQTVKNFAVLKVSNLAFHLLQDADG